VPFSPALPRRGLAALVVVALLLLGGGRALAAAPAPSAPRSPTASAGIRSVDLGWQALKFSKSLKDPFVRIVRDGTPLATVPGGAASFRDTAVTGGTEYSYYLVAGGTYEGTEVLSPPSSTVVARPTDALVGAATADITPPGIVNQGGFGLGDGTLFPDFVTSRGGQNQFQGEHIRARAMVIDDGTQAVAIADIETQGMFAAYEDGPWGLADMAAQVEADIPGLPADHILIASDHTHSGPDTIGAWGGVAGVQVPGYEGPNQYLRYIKDQTVTAIEEAYRSRRPAELSAGESNASTLIYNQSCSEALNQDRDELYPGPELCATPGKDGMMRVLQATTPEGEVVVTFVAYAAHATAGGGPGLHGDWPQFLSDALAAKYGGVGLAMQGANGGTQPCRPACSFTDPNEPGYDIGDRRTAYMTNYMAHVADALSNESSQPVRGPVAAAQSYIREPITGPAVLALFLAGQYGGARLLRSHENPWVVGDTIRTVASAIRIGDVLVAGTPGEGFFAIGEGVRKAVDARLVFQLGLANDQLGYLIAPFNYVPIIAAEAPVNDNIIFNVSPTIGDHVMCADIRLSLSLGFEGASPAECTGYDSADAAGDPVAAVPIGGPVLPDGLPLP
jgi:hypothetical protein